MKTRDPRFKLVAFGVLLPILMAAPVFSAVWLAGCSMVLLVAGFLPLGVLGRGLWRLRWLFVILVLTHGWFTPGEPLWSVFPGLTQEGLVAGGQQSLRLVLLTVLAQTVMMTTTPMELVGVFERFLGGLERFGVPVRRGLAILTFTLITLPRVIAETTHIQEDLALRIHTSHQRPRSLDRLVYAGEALLLRMLWDVKRREESLRARGMDETLPQVQLASFGSGWRDWGLILPPMVLWWLW